MKSDEEILGEACRVEVEEITGRVFIVFEIKNEKHKQNIIKNWTNDIEFKLINKSLITND